jgi:hypothetical protein
MALIQTEVDQISKPLRSIDASSRMRAYAWILEPWQTSTRRLHVRACMHMIMIQVVQQLRVWR